ncbi:MAG TPA: iron dicitrate transport regulator FecR, partial [Ideonella sp.]|nr:iron dicitrate transport regulator FecR [Ideonella sp.]
MNRAPAAGAPREKLVERALALVVQAELASPARASTALLAWAGRSAEHQAAAEEAQRRWAALGGMAGPLREHFGEPAAQPTGASRRHLLLSAAALLGTGLLAARAAQWAWQAWHAPLYAAQHRTGTAEL